MLFTLVSCVFLLSCQSTKIIGFYHESSEIFFNTGSLNSSVRKDLEEDLVAIYVDMNKKTFDEYVVWFGFISIQNNVEVEVVNARIYSEGWSLEESDFGLFALNNFDTNKGVYRLKEDLKIFDFSIGDKSFNENDVKHIKLDVNYLVNGVKHQATLKLIKKEMDYPVFRT